MPIKRVEGQQPAAARPAQERPKAAPMPVYLALDRCLPDRQRQLLAEGCSERGLVFGYPVLRSSGSIVIMMMFNSQGSEAFQTWESNFCARVHFDPQTFTASVMEVMGPGKYPESSIELIVKRVLGRIVPDPSFIEPKPRVEEEPLA